MARRERLRAPNSEYRDADGNAIVLRGSLSPATRASYARIASGEDLAPGASREDAWQRAVEFLFERLRDLLARLRVASGTERAWLRERMREHCAAHFPDLAAP